MLKQRLKDDLIKYMRAKDKISVTAIRMINSAIADREKVSKQEITDDEVIAIVDKAIKQYKETLEYAKQAVKEDIVQETVFCIELLSEYMPIQLSQEEVVSIIKDIIKTNNLKGQVNLGKVMKQVMPMLKGRFDTKLVNGLVSKELE